VDAHDDGHEDEAVHQVGEDQRPVGQVVVDVVLQLVREAKHALLRLPEGVGEISVVVTKNRKVVLNTTPRRKVKY
jgi:hypothetical protein